MGLTVKILSYVVEDDSDTLEIIEHVLKANNIQDFSLFTNPDEMLAGMGADIIIGVIDYYLKGALSGLDVLREIKRRNPNSFVIIMSGVADAKIIIQLLNAGANKYIDKNDTDYLNHLVEYMQEGLSEAKKRWELVNFLEKQMVSRKPIAK